MREISANDAEGKINNELNMKLNMRSFVNTLIENKAELIASEAHLEFSPSFADLILDLEIDSGMALDPEVTDEELLPP